MSQVSIERKTLIPIGFAIFLAMGAVTLASSTSARFVSLEKDMLYYAQKVEDQNDILRELRTEIRDLRSKMDSIHNR